MTFHTVSLLGTAMNILHVSGLPSAFTDQQLRNLFASYGTVVSGRIVLDDQGRSTGLGIIEMSSPEELEAVLHRDRLWIGGIQVQVWKAPGHLL